MAILSICIWQQQNEVIKIETRYESEKNPIWLTHAKEAKPIAQWEFSYATSNIECKDTTFPLSLFLSPLMNSNIFLKKYYTHASREIKNMIR